MPVYLIRAMQWLLRNALHLLYSNNTTVGNNVATHDGMLSARLFYWILNSPDLLDVNSPTNRGLTIVELGAGRGLCSFLAGSISIVRRRILAVELIEARCDEMNVVRAIMQIGTDNGGLGNPTASIPEVIRGSFTDREEPVLGNEIANGRLLMLYNNAGEIMCRDKTQILLESRLSQCLIGTVILSLGRMFQGDLSWDEEVYRTYVRKYDVSWISGRNQAAPHELLLWKYTKRGHAMGVGRNMRERPFNPISIHFPYSANRPEWPL